MSTPPELSTLELDIDQGVAHVRLNRPARANAMNAALWQELAQVFSWLDTAVGVRAVVISGRGKHFCAGMDLEVFATVAADQAGDAARRAERLRDTVAYFQACLNTVEACRKPVLAAIHGVCYGGGLALAACCDMRYGAADSRFSIKEIDLGMTADVGTLQRLPHLIPRGLVHELAYTGREMEASEAAGCGLLNAVREDADAARALALEWARHIAVKSPVAVRGTKRVLLHSRDHTVAQGLEYVATWNAGMLSVTDVMSTLDAGPGVDPPFED